jgi:hypothetical protein
MTVAGNIEEGSYGSNPRGLVAVAQGPESARLARCRASQRSRFPEPTAAVQPWRLELVSMPREPSFAVNALHYAGRIGRGRPRVLRDGVIEPAGTVAQQHDNEHAPFLADAGQDLADLLAILVQRMGHCSGHLGVPW